MCTPNFHGYTVVQLPWHCSFSHHYDGCVQVLCTYFSSDDPAVGWGGAWLGYSRLDVFVSFVWFAAPERCPPKRISYLYQGPFTPSVSVNTEKTLQWRLWFCSHWKQCSRLKMGCKPNLERLHCFQWGQNCYPLDADAWCKITLIGVSGTSHKYCALRVHLH